MSLITRHTHSDRLERWLGAEEVARISLSMKDWHGGPIAIKGVPGAVFAAKGGDFVGPIEGGGFANLYDYAERRVKAAARAARSRDERLRRENVQRNHAGFSSLSDLIAEASAGKAREFNFYKSGTTGVVAATSSLWRVGAHPAAGAAAAAAPGGTVPTSASAGAFAFSNPTGGDTQHFVMSEVFGTVSGNTLLLYDRIFAVAVNMNSTGTQSVTGVPTRYQSTTATDPDYAGSNFLFFECGSALAATAHNWTTCLYTDQSGNTGATLPSLTGNSACIVNRLDHPTGQWFAPLASGDSGILALTQVQLSAAVASGTCDAVIGRPIAFMPAPLANLGFIVDGINSAFNLVRIFDDACLAFLEILKPASTATAYTGRFRTVAG